MSETGEIVDLRGLTGICDFVEVAEVDIMPEAAAEIEDEKAEVELLREAAEIVEDMDVVGEPRSSIC